MSIPRVLVVGGDPLWLDRLRDELGRDRYEVIAAADANQAVQCTGGIRCELAVVAPGVPDDEILTFCRGLRGQASLAPPLLLSPARLVLGQDAADEGDGREQSLAEEIAALIEHTVGVFRDLWTRREVESSICRNGIDIDRACHRLTVDGRDVKFTPTEFRILWTLISDPGFVFSRQQLLELCVGDNAPSHERTIDVHIKAIRQKLLHRADSIETVRGIGYRFRDEPEPEDAGSRGQPPG